MITQERIDAALRYFQKAFTYYPESGIIIRKQCFTNSAKVGDVVGCIDKKTGYLRIGINNKLYYSHRLIWLYMTGEWPKDEIDHINGIRSDNRWSNLRSVEARGNCQNKIKNRGGHLPGTTFRQKNKKWESMIKIDGKSYHLGLYDTAQEAHEAYMLRCNQLRLGIK